jgi:hypothetical protein
MIDDDFVLTVVCQLEEGVPLDRVRSSSQQRQQQQPQPCPGKSGCCDALSLGSLAHVCRRCTSPLCRPSNPCPFPRCA